MSDSAGPRLLFSLSQSSFTSAHFICTTTSCCTLSLIQDFHSHLGTVDRIATCLIGSLLHRHKNISFAGLFTRALQRLVQAEHSDTSKAAWVSYWVIFPSLLLSLCGQNTHKIAQKWQSLPFWTNQSVSAPLNISFGRFSCSCQGYYNFAFLNSLLFQYCFQLSL